MNLFYCDKILQCKIDGICFNVGCGSLLHGSFGGSDACGKVGIGILSQFV